MLRVQRQDLKEGMILAEPILDVNGKVLLADKAEISQKHIQLMQTWDIGFICIREPGDTDESIAAELKVDRIRIGDKSQFLEALQLGINTNQILSILQGKKKSEQFALPAEYEKDSSLETLFNEQTFDYYGRFLNIIEKTFHTSARNKTSLIKDMVELAQPLANFILCTEGVIGYALRSIAAKNELARHTLAVTIISGKIALLLEYNKRDLGILVLGALLHDIGKINFPPEIISLSKNASESQRRLYESHISQGISLVTGKAWMPKEVLLTIAQHHERINGNGFPIGFLGEKIHPFARIVALADYVDHVMYTGSGEGCNLLDLIRQLPLMNQLFDIGISTCFINYLRDFLLSNVIQLEDGRQAQIVFMHQSLREPIIKTSDGTIIDLNKVKNISIKKYSL